MSYTKHLTEDRRLMLLRGLASTAQYRANAHLLRRFVEQVGHTASVDQVAADLAWLREAGLVTLDSPAPDVTVAVLTERGLDVADGRAEHPGVAKPRPQA